MAKLGQVEIANPMSNSGGGVAFFLIESSSSPLDFSTPALGSSRISISPKFAVVHLPLVESAEDAYDIG